MSIFTIQGQGAQPRRARRLPMRRVVFVFLVVGMLILASCGDDDDSGDPAAALNAYVDGINAGSLDDVMAAFAEDSRLIDHPLYPGESNGKTEIRRGLAETVGNARVDPDAYSTSDVLVDGDTVSWSYVWVRDTGEPFCAVGNEIDVGDEGLIVELRWGNDPGECNE